MKSKRSTKFYRKNEAEVMKRLGFSPVANSGAGWISKEDGESDKMLCQLKSTDKESISIKQHDLHALEIHALESHKLPVFAFQFLNRDEVWLAVKESDIEDFKRLIQGQDKPKCYGVYDCSALCAKCKYKDKCANKTRGNGKKRVDDKEETGYNYCIPRRESIEAREEFYRAKGREKEKREREYKEMQKERRRCRKRK